MLLAIVLSSMAVYLRRKKEKKTD